MIYLVSNPFCPYCYGNDRTLEKELPNLDDNDITILPMNLTPDMQEFDDKMYETYRNMFEKEATSYLNSIGLYDAKYYKKENIVPSKNVFLTYYFLREHNLGLKFYHEVTKRFYESDFNYNDIDSLSAIVVSYGVDKEEYLEAIIDPQYETMYLENMSLVDDADIDTVPTYVIDNEVYGGIKKAIAKIKATSL